MGQMPGIIESLLDNAPNYVPGRVRYPKEIITHLVLLDIFRRLVLITPPVFELNANLLEFSGPCMKYKFVHTYIYTTYFLSLGILTL